MDALRELLAIARAVGARRRQGESAASLDERAEADEVDRLLEALAELRVDARAPGRRADSGRGAARSRRMS